MDERNEITRFKFPLRKIPLDVCECGHDDSYHDTDFKIYNVSDGACAKCVCDKFTLPNAQNKGV